MFGLGAKEIFVIAVFALILFGPKKIPEIARNLADAVKSIGGAFKDSEKDTKNKA